MRMKSTLDVIPTSIKEFARSNGMTRHRAPADRAALILDAVSGHGPYRISGNPGRTVTS